MRWLHTQSYYYFESANFYLTIPNVVISTLNGGFTMSLTSLFPDPNSQRAATTVIGLVSIFSAMLTTMNQYIKSQQMMESHRAAGLAYGKLHRMISNELSLRRDQRSNSLEFLKQVRVEQDRLETTSPCILPSVIHKFNIQFKDKDIEKPEITGDLDEVDVNRKNRRSKLLYSPNEDEPAPTPLLKTVMSKVSNIYHTIIKPEPHIHSTETVTKTSESKSPNNSPLNVPANIIIETKKN